MPIVPVTIPLGIITRNYNKLEIIANVGKSRHVQTVLVDTS